MYYGVVKKPEDQLPGLISAYVQSAGTKRGHRVAAGTGELRAPGEMAAWRIESVGGQGCWGG